MGGFSEYEDYDALGLAELIAAGEVSAVEVLDAAIERIERHNERVNAVVEKLYDQARQTLAQGLPQGPLAGVPYMLKDLTALYTGTRTTFGSRLYGDFVADHDSTITERYRAAGLVILGKTNTPEFGLSPTTEPVLHGPTRNPYDMTRSAGGSSGGAAAAVAARMLPMAHATDGGGSIRIPAANCGVFGLKPTRARNPAGPDIGEGWSGLACGHAVTRSVRDSAALLDATHGPASGDPYHAPAPTRPFIEEARADPGNLRIGMMTHAPNGVPVHSECVRGVVQTAELLAELGHTVEEAAPDYDIEPLQLAMRTVIGANVRNVLDLRGHVLGREVTPHDVETISWAWSELGKHCSATDYAHCIHIIHGVGRRFGDFFQTYDLLLSPTLAAPPLPLGRCNMMSEDLNAYLGELNACIPFTPPFNLAGNPAASLPLHWTDDGLPVGIQLGADFGDEATLFRISAQLEQARPWYDRRPDLSE